MLNTVLGRLLISSINEMMIIYGGIESLHKVDVFQVKTKNGIQLKWIEKNEIVDESI